MEVSAGCNLCTPALVVMENGVPMGWMWPLEYAGYTNGDVVVLLGLLQRHLYLTKRVLCSWIN